MRRTLGQSGIDVSGIGMGCWAIGGPFHNDNGPSGWGEVDDEESTRTIHRALELGVDFFDTADVYGAGHSERVLGRALAGRRDQVAIATKWGWNFDEATKYAVGGNDTAAYVRQAVAASLDRLGTDYIDLYQLHIGDLAADRAAALLEPLEALVEEGKIRAYGWSTDLPDRAESWARDGAHFAAVQHDCSVLHGSPEMLEVCERHGLASVDRGPLAMGLLTGKYTAATQVGPGDVRGSGVEWMTLFGKDGRPSAAHLARLESVREVLTSEGRTLAQGALAWLWAVSDRTVPIPGCRTVAQVEDNAGALDKGPLTAAQVAEIAALLGP